MAIYRITNTAMIKIFRMQKLNTVLKSFKMSRTIVTCRSTWANLVSVVVMVALTPSGIAPSRSAKQSVESALSPRWRDRGVQPRPGDQLRQRVSPCFISQPISAGFVPFTVFYSACLNKMGRARRSRAGRSM